MITTTLTQPCPRLCCLNAEDFLISIHKYTTTSCLQQYNVYTNSTSGKHI